MTEKTNKAATYPSETMIIWSWEDVRKLRPRWSRKHCEEALDRISRRLVDRSIEVGWEVMEDLLRIRE